MFILKKIGVWVWVSGWVYIPKPKTQKFLNQNPKPKNIYTQAQNLKIFMPKPKT